MKITVTIDTERNTINADYEYGAYWGLTEWYDVDFNTMNIATLIEDIKEDMETDCEEEE